MFKDKFNTDPSCDLEDPLSEHPNRMQQARPFRTLSDSLEVQE